MEDKKWYRVKNTGKVIYTSWTKDLFTDEQLKEWEDYKIAELREKSVDERDVLNKMPEANRIKQWVTARAMGVDPVMEDFRDGKIRALPTNYRAEYMFKLPLGESFLTESQRNHFRIYEKKEIIQRLKLGQSAPDVQYEGFLEFEELDYNPLIHLDHLEKLEMMVEVIETEGKPKIKVKEDKSIRVTKEVYICKVCGKELKSRIGLLGHSRRHKK